MSLFPCTPRIRIRSVELYFGFWYYSNYFEKNSQRDQGVTKIQINTCHFSFLDWNQKLTQTEIQYRNSWKVEIKFLTKITFRLFSVYVNFLSQFLEFLMTFSHHPKVLKIDFSIKKKQSLKVQVFHSSLSYPLEISIAFSLSYRLDTSISLFRIVQLVFRIAKILASCFHKGIKMVRFLRKVAFVVAAQATVQNQTLVHNIEAVKLTMKPRKLTMKEKQVVALVTAAAIQSCYNVNESIKCEGYL